MNPSAGPARSGSRPASARRRDRHGRGPRGPLAWPPVPAMVARSARFDELVLDAADRLEHRLGTSLEHVELAVEDVPPSDPASWEESVPLGRLFPAENRSPARVVVYRRPVESRAEGARDLAELVDKVVTEQVAGLLGIPPEDLED
ncbi:metallopeptidase family protein [Luteipulveratus sp. YIM 133132]|uniref:Metallopeptidase family protein n=2 Tax=Luteipulveratus flavus TaxID=3031728 RepID=A0ABT6C200_9MICO|nr:MULTISPECIES: metallopeptidase family protein [unclassified Luteipulveratus]MDE9367710.1 metallopeptidase family protein [Luteipulveratus sp. YIM 133132]MDF8262921.1 metallopeptidase family protein [Luteipulveratus sp. YIM 133296]